MARRRSKKVVPKRKASAGGKKTVCTTTNLRCQVAKKGKATTMKTKLAKEAPLDIEVDMDAAYDMKHRSRPRLENWNFSNMAVRGLSGDNMTKLTSKTRKVRVPGGGVRYITEYMGDLDDKKKPEEIANEAAGDLEIGDINRRALRAGGLRNRGRRGVARPPRFVGAGGLDLNNNDDSDYMSAVSSHSDARSSVMSGALGSGGSEVIADRGGVNAGAEAGYEQWQLEEAQRDRPSPPPPSDYEVQDGDDGGRAESKSENDDSGRAEEKSENSSRQLEHKPGHVDVATPAQRASSVADNVMTLDERSSSFAFPVAIRLVENADESLVRDEKAMPKGDNAAIEETVRRRLKLHESQGYGAGQSGGDADDEQPVDRGFNMPYLRSWFGGSAQKKKGDKSVSSDDVETGLSAYLNVRGDDYEEAVAKEEAAAKSRIDAAMKANTDHYTAIIAGANLPLSVLETWARSRTMADAARRAVTLRQIEPSFDLGVNLDTFARVEEGARSADLAAPERGTGIDGPFARVEEGARSVDLHRVLRSHVRASPSPGSAVFGAPLVVVPQRLSLREQRRLVQEEVKILADAAKEASFEIQDRRDEERKRVGLRFRDTRRGKKK